MLHQLKSSVVLVYDVTEGTQSAMHIALTKMAVDFVAEVQKRFGPTTAREIEVVAVQDQREQDAEAE